MTPVLSVAILATLVCYAVAMLLALWRLLAGPSAQDRVLALDLLYTVGMLVMMVLGLRYASAMYFEGALLVALFGFISASMMAKFLLRGEVIE